MTYFSISHVLRTNKKTQARERADECWQRLRIINGK